MPNHEKLFLKYARSAEVARHAATHMPHYILCRARPAMGASILPRDCGVSIRTALDESASCKMRIDILATVSDRGKEAGRRTEGIARNASFVNRHDLRRQNGSRISADATFRSSVRRLRPLKEVVSNCSTTRYSPSQVRAPHFRKILCLKRVVNASGRSKLRPPWHSP